MKYYIGVDVGTSSVRAALVDNRGRIIQTAVKHITIKSIKPGFYEQSSDEIWKAVQFTVKKVISDSGVDKNDINGIGFDATCSLVVLDDNCVPLSVSPQGGDRCNIIMWMDHRASEETELINSTKDEVLNYCGGNISIEMNPPKILWLKKNLSEESWKRIGHFFDLPDFLTWKSTGSLSRSLCSLVCKYTYQAARGDNKGWSDEFFRKIGLADLIDDNYTTLGCDVRPPGTPCGEGITSRAADELGLNVGTAVATSIIDAHSGVIGCLGCHPREGRELEMPPLTSRMTLICGTSTCHMALSQEPCFVPGVWGPYYSAILPDVWDNEGGQSASGKLIDFIVESHPAYSEALKTSSAKGIHIHTYLNDILQEKATENGLKSVAYLTKDLHIWPDFHGNRSPLADPSLKGMISGLSLSIGVDQLALLYFATIQALTYGTRHIISEMRKHGCSIDVVYMCGGLRKNKLFVQCHTDILGLPVILPFEEESVLLGSSILGAVASKDFPSFKEALDAMGGEGEVILPDVKHKTFHDAKYEIFLKMVEDQKQYKQIMEVSSN